MEEIYIGKINNKKVYIIFINLLDIDYLTVNSKSYLLLFVDNNFKTKTINDILISNKNFKCYLNVV